MGFSYEIDHEKKCMYSHVSGPITYKDLMAHITAEARDKGHVYPELFDAREQSRTSDEVRRFIDFLQELGRKIHAQVTHAVVVSNRKFNAAMFQ